MFKALLNLQSEKVVLWHTRPTVPGWRPCRGGKRGPVGRPADNMLFHANAPLCGASQSHGLWS